MSSNEHKIVRQILDAQKDVHAADELVRQYLPFIKSETFKFIRRPPVEGQDDELSIAMFAFYETMMAYKKERGSFLNLAAVGIQNRLIDYFRREQRHGSLISLDQTTGEEDGRQLWERIPDDHSELQEYMDFSAAQCEIEAFSKDLACFGLSLTDIAKNCPKQDRTLSACLLALEYAKHNPQLLEQMVQSKKLPLSQLAAGSGVGRKTLERHRTYLIAILLAYTNGFEIIRGHLHQMKGGEHA